MSFFCPNSPKPENTQFFQHILKKAETGECCYFCLRMTLTISFSKCNTHLKEASNNTKDRAWLVLVITLHTTAKCFSNYKICSNFKSLVQTVRNVLSLYLYMTGETKSLKYVVLWIIYT